MTVVSIASFLQADAHPAHSVRRMIQALAGNRGGVIPATATFTDLKVTQRGAGANMSVDVAGGECFVHGTESTYQGVYHCQNQGTQNVVITAADATNARRDLIVARIKDSEYGVAVTDVFSIEAVAGTPAGSPADPTVPDNCIVLARVAVAAAASSITNANITDLRNGYTAVTGSATIGNQVKAVGMGGVGVCTSSFRPTVGIYEGQLIWETDTNRMLRYSGSAWLIMNGAFHSTVSSYQSTTSYASTGASFSLPAGNWIIQAKCDFGNAAGSAGTHPFIQIWDNTASSSLDTAEAYLATASIVRVPMSAMAPLSSTSTKTIQLRAKDDTGGANYTFDKIRLWAMATGGIS